MKRASQEQQSANLQDRRWPLCVTGSQSQRKVGPGTPEEEPALGAPEEGSVTCSGALDDPWRTHIGLPPARRKTDGLAAHLDG